MSFAVKSLDSSILVDLVVSKTLVHMVDNALLGLLLSIELEVSEEIHTDAVGFLDLSFEIANLRVESLL